MSSPGWWGGSNRAGSSRDLERIATLGASSLSYLRALWRNATARCIALRHITIAQAKGRALPKPAEVPSSPDFKNGARRPVNNPLSDAQLTMLRDEVKGRHPSSGSDRQREPLLKRESGRRTAERPRSVSSWTRARMLA